MTTPKEGGPAFPIVEDESKHCFTGMTLRDFFAATAMISMVPTLMELDCRVDDSGLSRLGALVNGALQESSSDTALQFFAHYAYEVADAMLVERKAGGA